MSEIIDAILEKVVWKGTSRDGGDRIIGKFMGGKSIKGDILNPVEGERYRFRGEWRAGDPKYGPEFHFTSYEPIVDMTTSGVEQYLRSHIDGLGVAKAAALVEEFGVETLDILRDDPEAALSIPKITPEIVAAIREHFDNVGANDPKVEARLIDLFRGHDFPRNLVKKVTRAYPSGAVDRVMQNPYLLLQFKSAGWKRVDSFATTTAKYDPAGIERHRGAIVEAFEVLAADGHTCGTMPRVESIASGLLGMATRKDAWSGLAADGKIVAHKSCEGDEGIRWVALAKYAMAEQEIARRLVLLMEEALPLPGGIEIEGLAEEQEEAVEVAKGNGVAIITGSPGTGKSLSTAKFLGSIVDAGVSPDSIAFAAPTGVASKRGKDFLAEYGISDIYCSTIHKILAPSPTVAEPGAAKPDAKKNRERQAFGFSRNEANPIPYGVVELDELSMADTLLFSSFLKAIRPGTRLLIVGDENQLPSVGPGSVLRDMMASGIPSYTLREIRRSNAAGTVVHACHAIRDGKIPVPADCIDLANHKNWVHIEEDDPQAIADIIVQLHANAKNYDPVGQMQVVTPQHGRHPFAGDPLNFRLSALLNPVAREAIESAQEAERNDDHKKSYIPPFHRGDKVIRTKNELVNEMVNEEKYNAAQEAGEEWAEKPFKPGWTYRGVGYFLNKVPVVNGDMGTVVEVIDVPKVGRQVVVALKDPDRLVRLSHAEAEIAQAYALTCHRVQGAGFPYVVIPVHNAVYGGLMTREWFYTALSRTKEVCVTVGQFSAIEAAVGRYTVWNRQTRLGQMLKAELEEMVERTRMRDARAAMDDPDGLGSMIEGEGMELVAVGD